MPLRFLLFFHNFSTSRICFSCSMGIKFHIKIALLLERCQKRICIYNTSRVIMQILCEFSFPCSVGSMCWSVVPQVPARRNARSDWIIILMKTINQIRRANGPGRVRPRVQPWSVLFCSQTAQSGRPRAHGGQSRCQAVGLDPGQSPAGPWRLHMRDGFVRRIQDSPLKCRDSSRRSTSSLQTAFWKRLLT